MHAAVLLYREYTCRPDRTDSRLSGPAPPASPLSLLPQPWLIWSHSGDRGRFDIQHLQPSLDVAMATLMEFAALQLDGAGGHGRAAAGPGDAPPVGVARYKMHMHV